MQRPGANVVVDPVSRKVTEIDGKPVTDHTDELQAFADAVLAEAGIAAPVAKAEKATPDVVLGQP